MTSQARGPKTLKGALVSVPDSGSPTVIEFQYNPASMKRTLQTRMVGGEENERSQALRYTGAAVQVIEVEIEFDAVDMLEKGDSTATKSGIYPQLSALELLAYPTLDQVNQNQSKLQSGTMEVIPLTAPRILFTWGPNRVLPVRINTYTISEEAFDTNLNPIRAVVSLSMQVLTYYDLSSDNKGYNQFKAYQQTMVTMAGKATTSKSNNIGVDTGKL